MKRLIIFLGVSALLLCACEKENYPVYDVNQKDGIFLDYSESYDSVFYNFGFDSKNEYIYPVRIAVSGMPRNYERTVKLKINQGKYASEEFIAAKEAYFELSTEFTFPKNVVVAELPVKLIRDPELEDVRAILTFELLESDDFVVRGHSEFTITFDDKTPKPPLWWNWHYSCLGGFTKLKGQLFFKYFWEMEQENKYVFDKIVDYWGRNLEQHPYEDPFDTYPFAINTYVFMKMWEYSEAHPELNLNISKPIIF